MIINSYANIVSLNICENKGVNKSVNMGVYNGVNMGVYKCIDWNIIVITPLSV